MGQKLQDGEKVLEMSVTSLHSKCRPVQTMHPTDLDLLASWLSISRPEIPEIPGNLYFQKTSEKRLESRKFKIIRPLLL